jgi:hypothetical protein
MMHSFNSYSFIGLVQGTSDGNPTRMANKKHCVQIM